MARRGSEDGGESEEKVNGGDWWREGTREITHVCDTDLRAPGGLMRGQEEKVSQRTSRDGRGLQRGKCERLRLVLKAAGGHVQIRLGAPDHM